MDEVKVDVCLEVPKKEKQENSRKQIGDTRDQAERVAWRIFKDWVEAVSGICQTVPPGYRKA